MEREQEVKMNKSLKDVKTLVVLGVMLAFTIILDFTPLGAIPLFGVINATINHLPTVVTGIILGPIAGAIIGAAFGIVSMFHAITRPNTILAPLFMNPLVSVLPRIFIGVMSYYGYVLFKKINKESKKVNVISIFTGGVIGSLTNTILVLTMLYIVYKDKIEEMISTVPKMAGTSVKAFVIGIGTTQGIGESIVIGILTVPIVIAWQKTKKRV